MPAPFRLEQSLPITRGTDGKFQEFDRAVPPNPLDAAEDGQQPVEWAPGIGQGSAPVHGPSHGQPAPAPVNKPFRLG